MSRSRIGDFFFKKTNFNKIIFQKKKMTYLICIRVNVIFKEYESSLRELQKKWPELTSDGIRISVSVAPDETVSTLKQNLRLKLSKLSKMHLSLFPTDRIRLSIRDKSDNLNYQLINDTIIERIIDNQDNLIYCIVRI